MTIVCVDCCSAVPAAVDLAARIFKFWTRQIKNTLITHIYYNSKLIIVKIKAIIFHYTHKTHIRPSINNIFKNLNY
jgi:hypothetical protein